MYRKGSIEGRDESLIALLFHEWLGVTEEREEEKNMTQEKQKISI